MRDFPIDPIQFIIAMIAIAGGVARYLNAYTQGASFKLGLLLASSMVAGFAGYMFALIGISLSLPESMLFMMAGTGGFFAERTMQLVLEFINKKSHIA